MLEGWRRAILAPWVTVGILLVTILVSLPLAFTLREEIAADLGPSTTSERVERGWDAELYVRQDGDQFFRHRVSLSDALRATIAPRCPSLRFCTTKCGKKPTAGQAPRGRNADRI